MSIGQLTNPIFKYENCTNIYIECDEKSGEKRRLLRTNWPENEIIYVIDMNIRSKASILWFNVKCDQKTHEWKYDGVDNNEDIVTEYVICHSV